jgi:hypothetical protein
MSFVNGGKHVGSSKLTNLITLFTVIGAFPVAETGNWSGRLTLGSRLGKIQWLEAVQLDAVRQLHQRKH